MLRTALQAGIGRLYHYEKYNPLFLQSVLTTGQIYCSDPTSLNDPWDCRPWFSDIEDPDEIERFIKWVFSFKPTAPVSEEEVKATQKTIRTNPEYRSALVRSFSESFLDLIPGRWRIYCVTPLPGSTLMWSHYGDNHKEICLEFGVDNPLFATAQSVRYLSSYPGWSPHAVMESSARDILLTKSDDWKYEHEYRIIAMGERFDRPIDAHPLFLTGNCLRIPDGALKAVIAGCEADHDGIVPTVKNCAPGLKVKRAVRSPSRYRSEIVD
jgi:Protein of unknown function (DUF2971)